MPEIALGTKVFMRYDELKKLLDSVPKIVSRVIIADDGQGAEGQETGLDNNYSFDLEVLDLEYDSGLGFGRKRIVDELEEDYLIIVDTDHRVPHNVDVLISQLETLPNVGGISGSIIEPEVGRIWQNAADLFEKERELYLNRQEKDIRVVSESPFVGFDYIPNAVAFKKECLDEYCWDPNYVIGREHLDFYVGHWKNTDWRFGVCPEVLFPHYPGGDKLYMLNRKNNKKLADSRIYFLKKWGYTDFYRQSGYWFDTGGNTKTDGIDVSDTIEKYATELYISKEVVGWEETLKRGIRSSPLLAKKMMSSILSSF